MGRLPTWAKDDLVPQHDFVGAWATRDTTWWVAGESLEISDKSSPAVGGLVVRGWGVSESGTRDPGRLESNHFKDRDLLLVNRKGAYTVEREEKENACETRGKDERSDKVRDF